MSVVRITVGSLVFVMALAGSARASAISNDPAGWTLWLPSTGAIVPEAAPAVPQPTPTPAPPPPPVAAPAPAPAPAPSIAPAAVAASTFSAPATTTFASSSASASPWIDAIVNFGAGPYPNQGEITTGGALPWYDSPQVAHLFGGTPTSQQQADFSSTVLQRVAQTFQLAGIPVTLSSDPSVHAPHMLSIVSNTSSQLLSTAIGMTEIGGSGFSFIDPIAKSAQSVDQLAWIVAHNVSHELMLAFGVPEHYDQTGNFIDATNASWAMMNSPTATFSTAAAQALLAANFQNGNGSGSGQGAQLIDPQPVPEPATALVWGLGAALSVAALGKKRRTPRAGTL